MKNKAYKLTRQEKKFINEIINNDFLTNDSKAQGIINHIDSKFIAELFIKPRTK